MPPLTEEGNGFHLLSTAVHRNHDIVIFLLYILLYILYCSISSLGDSLEFLLDGGCLMLKKILVLKHILCLVTALIKWTFLCRTYMD